MGAGGGGGFGGAGFDFGDIFSSFFGGGGGFGGFGGGGGGRRSRAVDGDDIYTRVALAFEEAVEGVKRDITYRVIEECPDCHGSGAAKGTEAETCSQCHGSGQTTVNQRTPFGMMQSTRTCDKCRGTGKFIETPCKNCRGGGFVRATKKLSVNIPAGIDDGQRISLRGEGSEGRNGGYSGDLIISVNVRPHAFYERDGYDVYCDVPVTFVDATLGAKIKIPTIYGEEELEIPEGTQTGTTFTLRGKGIQVVNSKNKGNMYININVEVPKGLNSKQKEILRQFDEACGRKNHAKKDSFMKKFFKKD
jgi:molecular chaperone DnaJ